MGTIERLERMREHFTNITIEEFEHNLQKAGIEEINPAADYGYQMVLAEYMLDDYNAPVGPMHYDIEKTSPENCEPDRISYDTHRSTELAA